MEEVNETIYDSQKFKGIEEVRRLLKEYVGRSKPQGRNEVNEWVQDFQKKLLDQMQNRDSLFKNIYKINKIQGSVKKGLKMGKPDEFDLDLCFRIPIEDPKDITITESKEYPSWFHCSFPEKSWQWPLPRNRRRSVWKNLTTKPTAEGVCRLRADSIRNWLQGLVHRAIKADEDLRQMKIRETRSGPAITLWVEITDLEKPIRISMDLVAAFEIPKDSWSCNFGEEYNAVETSSFLIPVAPRVRKGDSTPPNDVLRGSFPELEEHLLAGKDNLKDNIRLLKVHFKFETNIFINRNYNFSWYEVTTVGIPWQVSLSRTSVRIGASDIPMKI